MQASDNLAKLKEWLLYSLSLSSAVTEKPDQLSDAVMSEADNNVNSERHDDNTDSDKEKNDVAVKEKITELSSLFNDSFFCCVS